MRAFTKCALLVSVLAAAMALVIAVPVGEPLMDEAGVAVLMRLLQADLTALKEYELVQLFLKDAQAIDKRAPTGSGQCSVTGYTSECYGGISFNLFGQQINLDARLVAEYLPNEYGVRLKLTVLKKQIINEKVSVYNPPPVCAGVPRLNFFSICLKLSDLQADNGKFHGCFALQGKAIIKTLFSQDLGCANIG